MAIELLISSICLNVTCDTLNLGESSEQGDFFDFYYNYNETVSVTKKGKK